MVRRRSCLADAEPTSAAFPDLVALAGGAGPIVARARALLEAGEVVRALHLTDIALASEPEHRGALEARLAALQLLAASSRNYMERGWLRHAAGEAEDRLERLPAGAAADPAGGTSR
jgi:alkyl sulfatase BDS1-like metallo-beta-lactamase superfamily hydrolase